LLHRSKSTTPHTQRNYASHPAPTRCSDHDPQQSSQSQDLDYTYRLRHVPVFLSHMQIHSNLSYYGDMVNIQDVDNLPTMQRELLITFNHKAKISLLDHIWAVNVQGYNISIARAHLSDSQLKYRQQYVIGFRGFHYQTTESQALRLLRSYGGMTCYFQQNLAFVAFKSADQMHSVCRLRIYTEDDRLLTGHPRFVRNDEQLQDQPTTRTSSSCKAMSIHTYDQQDISSTHTPSNRPPTSRRV